MAYNSKAKLKTLYVYRFLEEETDAEHGLSMRQIIEHLAEVGIEAERKSVYRDIETLREFGVDICTYQRNPVEYAIERRDFSLSELMLLIDAVESCKALTRRQANALTTNLKLFASDHQRALLDRRIHVAGRIKSKGEGVFEKIDEIHRALHEKRQVEFKYYRYGPDGKRRATHEGLPYTITPIAVTYDSGFYYLTGWNDEADAPYEFRIDRMGPLKMSIRAATRGDRIDRQVYDKSSYEYFGRFDGEPVTVTFSVDEDKVDIIIDRFGETAQIMPAGDGGATAVARVRKSEQFFGWVAGMGGTIRIAKPKKLREEYHDYLRSLIEE